MLKKLSMLCWALVCVLLCASHAEAVQAEDLSQPSLMTKHKGFSSVRQLFDGRTIESVKIKDGGYFTLQEERGIGALYLVFGKEYGSYTVTDDSTGNSISCGDTGFLHEFLDLEDSFGRAPQQVTITFVSGEVQLNELSAFTPGQVPGWVQQWQKPAEGSADLVLFSTHGDDEQLFFAGMLPYYAAELGYEVQVVYLTGHRNMSMRRSHEMLDGLWAVGVKHYPVFGPFGDYNTRSLTEAYRKYSNKGITREELLSFVVENIRRFQPKVAVGHDLQGEYGHGMHMVYADLLCEAVEISADPLQFPASQEEYGVWDVPKTYLHLYPENQIVMDWDVPLSSFDGMTAFEVTKKLGFPSHISQQSYYSWYFNGKNSAASIKEYSPCQFGLYRSTVGEDIACNDLFENITTHGQDAALEEQRRAEAARRKAEEEAKRRAEDEEKRRAEEAARQAQETIPEATEPERLPEPWYFFWRSWFQSQ